MAPPPLSSASTRRPFSSFFTSSAISTAASPLQASFNLTCRSPIRPSHDVGARRSATSAKSPYLEPPSLFPLDVGTPDSRVTREGRDGQHHDCDGNNTVSDGSPTDQTCFLQPASPGTPAPANPGDEGKLGVVSAINIIVGKTVGVGAYTVPSAIFAGVGSVGMTLSVWVIGSLISFCGLAVYLDLGTAMPRSGGERVYLERIFRRPYMLATCMFMAYVVLLGFSTPNAIVLGEYALYAVDVPPNRWNVRVIAVATVSALCYVHSNHPKLGLRLINALGVAKMLILVIVVVSGVAGGIMGVGADRELLMGRRLDVPLSDVAARSTAQRNFADVWAGSSTQPYDYATALLKVIYCFRGYGTANQVLSDVKNPVRTLKIAAPVALTLVSVAYLAINVAFFLVVDKDDFRSAGVVAAGIFFRNVFGAGAGSRVLPLFIIISAAGNIAATSFVQARVNEELAKDGLLPFARFWTTTTAAAGPTSARAKEAEHAAAAKTKRARTAPSPPPPSPRPPPPPQLAPAPSRGLLLHWLVSAFVIVLPPPGCIYNFLVDLGGYPVSAVGAAVSAGLLYLRSSSRRAAAGGEDDEEEEQWRSTLPFRAPRAAVAVFAASNCLLLVLPWVPPRREDDRGGDGFAWYAYPATALGVLAAGAVWWAWWRCCGVGSRSGKEASSVRRRRERHGEDGSEWRLLGGSADEDDGEERGEGSVRVVEMGRTVGLAVGSGR